MSIYDFKVKTNDGSETTLSSYRGKVLLVVNVASECGFTAQYSGLEELHKKYKDRGFEVLAFPCNQFGGQEPGTDAQIKSFCESRFQISFPLFAKIDVNGGNAHPLYEYLKHEEKGFLGTSGIKWNFTKFLIGPDGTVVARLSPQAKPESLEAQIQALLPQ